VTRLFAQSAAGMGFRPVDQKGETKTAGRERTCGKMICLTGNWFEKAVCRYTHITGNIRFHLAVMWCTSFARISGRPDRG